MYEPLGEVTLKGGEVVQAGVVVGPDPDWAERLEGLLGHKGEVWGWQNARCLRGEVGLDIRYYLLHRDGAPFANILTATSAGVGHFGHVFTRPEDRRRGAASQLMGLQMADFRARGGRALFLGTGYDSPPYHIYRSHGFRGLEPHSGQMEYCAGSGTDFREGFFAEGPVRVVGASWSHWPLSAPLFTGDFPGAVRCAPLGLFGRASTEGAWLHLLHQDATRALVLEQAQTAAVVGVAAWSWHPLWPHTCLVDVYCHPAFWGHAAGLLDGLALPETDRTIAYSDDGCPRKVEVLAAAGFAPAARHARRVAADRARTGWVDVTEWQRG